jgi:T5orf172 domain
MSDYQYKNIPLTPSIAADHLIEYLSAQKIPMKRADVTRYVAQRHEALGGTTVTDSENRVKLALNRLVDEGKIIRPSTGWYLKISADDNDSSDSFDQQQLSTLDVSPEVELINAEETIGEGDELVYVYFHEADRKLASYENRTWWPCKVGFTAGNLTTRILSQGPLTSMARPPSVGLVIKTTDGHALERAIHFALDGANTRIVEAMGSEWFDTSPTRIKTWYEKYSLAVDILRF